MLFPAYVAALGLPKEDEKVLQAQYKAMRVAGKHPDPMLTRTGRVMCDRLVAQAERILGDALKVPESKWPDLLSRLSLMSDADWRQLRQKGVSFLGVKAKTTTNKAAKADK